MHPDDDSFLSLAMVITHHVACSAIQSPESGVRSVWVRVSLWYLLHLSAYIWRLRHGRPCRHTRRLPPGVIFGWNAFCTKGESNLRLNIAQTKRHPHCPSPGRSETLFWCCIIIRLLSRTLRERYLGSFKNARSQETKVWQWRTLWETH